VVHRGKEETGAGRQILLDRQVSPEWNGRGSGAQARPKNTFGLGGIDGASEGHAYPWAIPSPPGVAPGPRAVLRPLPLLPPRGPKPRPPGFPPQGHVPRRGEWDRQIDAPGGAGAVTPPQPRGR